MKIMKNSNKIKGIRWRRAPRAPSGLCTPLLCLSAALPFLPSCFVPQGDRFVCQLVFVTTRSQVLQKEFEWVQDALRPLNKEARNLPAKTIQAKGTAFRVRTTMTVILLFNLHLEVQFLLRLVVPKKLLRRHFFNTASLAKSASGISVPLVHTPLTRECASGDNCHRSRCTKTRSMTEVMRKNRRTTVT